MGCVVISMGNKSHVGGDGGKLEEALGRSRRLARGVGGMRQGGRLKVLG